MPELDATFAGSIPSIYDRCLGPLIFEPYAEDMARRVAEDAPRSVLETAAGTGIVTVALARALPTAAITATDLNQSMLDLAASKRHASSVTFRQADAQALPFEDGSFDAVVCQFGVMFFQDKPKAYREARRVLRPGGRFLLNVWDRIEENAFAHVVAQTIQAAFPDDPPQFMERTPHGYFDTGRIEADLRAAGFGEVATEAVDLQSRAPSAREPAVGFCQGTPMRSEIEARDASRLDALTDAAAAAIAQRFGNGPVAGNIRAFVIVAR
jgi:SAM-dependent methyltransferase